MVTVLAAPHFPPHPAPSKREKRKQWLTLSLTLKWRIIAWRRVAPSSSSNNNWWKRSLSLLIPSPPLWISSSGYSTSVIKIMTDSSLWRSSGLQGSIILELCRRLAFFYSSLSLSFSLYIFVVSSQIGFFVLSVSFLESIPSPAASSLVAYVVLVCSVFLALSFCVSLTVCLHVS